MPSDISNPLETACHKRYPDLVPRDETPFWESNNIFCSNDGLARRQEEYRVLLEEKIPENSEAIGKAASYGDLSENSEWEAAIEDQRNLTTKAIELTLAQCVMQMNDASDEFHLSHVVQRGSNFKGIHPSAFALIAAVKQYWGEKEYLQMFTK